MLMWCLEEPISREEDQGQDSIDQFDLVMLMWSLENPALLEEGQGHESIGRIVSSGEVRVGSCQRIPIDGRSYPWVGSVCSSSCFSEDDKTLWLSSFLRKDYNRYKRGIDALHNLCLLKMHLHMDGEWLNNSKQIVKYHYRFTSDFCQNGVLRKQLSSMP